MMHKHSKTKAKLLTLIAAAVSATLLSSCDKKEYVITEFPIDKELKAEPIKQLDSLVNAYNIVSNGETYVVQTAGTEYNFRAYDSSFKELNTFGHTGNGHDEWRSAYPSGQTTKDKDGNLFYVMETTAHKMYTLPLDGKGQRKEVADFDIKDAFGMKYAFEIAPGRFAGAIDDDNEYKFTIFDNKTKNKTEFPHPDFKFFLKSRMTSQILMQTRGTYNVKAEKIATTYFSYPLVVIRDTEGNIIHTMQIGDKWPEYNEQSAAEMRVTFLGCTSDEDYVYALYDDTTRPKESSILMFKWDGAPVARYHIDKARAFAVDSKNKRFIVLKADDSHGACNAYSFK